MVVFVDCVYAQVPSFSGKETPKTPRFVRFTFGPAHLLDVSCKSPKIGQSRLAFFKCPRMLSTPFLEGEIQLLSYKSIMMYQTKIQIWKRDCIDSFPLFMRRKNTLSMDPFWFPCWQMVVGSFRNLPSNSSLITCKFYKTTKDSRIDGYDGGVFFVLEKMRHLF